MKNSKVLLKVNMKHNSQFQLISKFEEKNNEEMPWISLRYMKHKNKSNVRKFFRKFYKKYPKFKKNIFMIQFYIKYPFSTGVCTLSRRCYQTRSYKIPSKRNQTRKQRGFK
jgi:hypothetical protein